MKELEKRYCELCNEYIKAFYKKHDMEFVEADLLDWVGQIGDIICIGDCYFNFSDVKYDVDNDVPGDIIFDWYYKYLEHGEFGLKYLNFESYAKGAPDPIPETELKHIKELRTMMYETRKELDKACEKYRDPELKGLHMY